jgi:Protein of unknown function (DUF3710)
VLRRRRSDGGEQAWAGPDEPAGDEVDEPGDGGPWDVNDDVPEAERIDFGSLRVPVREGFEVQVSMAEDQPAWVTVVSGDSGLQLQAFAAPKTGGLWADVRQEIAAEVAKAGGECEEVDGPFGVEVRALIAPPVPGAGGGRHPVRFLGVDGPRWFLRGVISGPAAGRDEDAERLEDVFADVVVARGDHPVPPRDLLEIRLPEEALRALGAEAGEPEGEPGEPGAERWGGIDPFGRGPEITETR